jgi:hypothetical protein
MNNNVYNNPLVIKFVNELGILLRIRINQYHRKFNKDNESNFLNKFIICPEIGDHDLDHIRHPALERKHFNDNLGIQLSVFDFNHISLANNKIKYSFSVFPDFIDNDDDGDLLEFSLIEDKITFYDQDMIDFLESCDDETLNQIILKVQSESSLNSLKN